MLKTDHNKTLKKMSSVSQNTPVLQKAIDLATKAATHDKNKNYSEAKRLYEQSVEHFLHVIKYEAPGERAKESIHAKCIDYLERAEKLKKYIASKKKDERTSENEDNTKSKGEYIDGPGFSCLKNKSVKGKENDLTSQCKNIDPKMIEMISNEIMDCGTEVNWDDIAGLEFAKTTIKEIIVWPMLRPDIFTGLLAPPRGLLLFGPPGTGKTLIGKCIASQSKSTFFSISASSLTSKWVGEGEKMVRALFAVAIVKQPSVIFIDEIDSLLGARSDGEHESSRRMKTEFLVQLDGAVNGNDDRLLVVGATNRPGDLDDAARRRLVKRLYIPLPDTLARRSIIRNLLAKTRYQMTDEEVEGVCQMTEGFSGADMAALCREAALGPIRSLQKGEILNVTRDQVRHIEYSDFQQALTQVKASVSQADLTMFAQWNERYGAGK